MSAAVSKKRTFGERRPSGKSLEDRLQGQGIRTPNWHSNEELVGCLVSCVERYKLIEEIQESSNMSIEEIKKKIEDYKTEIAIMKETIALRKYQSEDRMQLLQTLLDETPGYSSRPLPEIVQFLKQLRMRLEAERAETPIST